MFQPNRYKSLPLNEFRDLAHRIGFDQVANQFNISMTYARDIFAQRVNLPDWLAYEMGFVAVWQKPDPSDPIPAMALKHRISRKGIR